MSARIPPNSGPNRDCFGPGLSLDRLEAGRGGRIHFDSQLPGNWSHRYTSWSPDYRLVRSFIRSPLGPSVLLSLSVASFLTGGGVAQIVLFTLAWAGATQIGAPLGFWKRLLRPVACPMLGRLRPWTLGVSTAMFMLALEITVFGYVPGVLEQTLILLICWGSLAVALVLYLISIVSGFAHDIEGRDLISRR
jgi:hypothetical protein